jgi:hypothetical protein
MKPFIKPEIRNPNMRVDGVSHISRVLAPPKAVVGLGMGGNERLPFHDPDLDQMVDDPRKGKPPAKTPPPMTQHQGLTTMGTPISTPQQLQQYQNYPQQINRMTQSQEPSVVEGFFAPPMTKDDINNLSKRKRRIPHKFLKKAKVCVNCTFFETFKRGQDGSLMNLCTYHGGVPWDKSWTCSYSFCSNYDEKDKEEAVEEKPIKKEEVTSEDMDGLLYGSPVEDSSVETEVESE